MVALSCCLTLLTACDLSQVRHLELTKDNRLTFIAPKARVLVKDLPLRVAWTMRDFQATGIDGQSKPRAGAFALFVDIAPIAVGKTLKAVAKGDETCHRTPGCPDTAYLEAKGVYVTTQDHVDVPILPPAPKGVGDEQHTVTVILLDGTGVRRTESAWYRTFRTPRRQ